MVSNAGPRTTCEYLHSFSISKALALRLISSYRSTSTNPGGAGSIASLACLEKEGAIAAVVVPETRGLAGTEDGEQVEEP